eukprot:958190-Prymnesium_polylepis.2
MRVGALVGREPSSILVGWDRFAVRGMGFGRRDENRNRDTRDKPKRSRHSPATAALQSRSSAHRRGNIFPSRALARAASHAPAQRRARRTHRPRGGC